MIGDDRLKGIAQNVAFDHMRDLEYLSVVEAVGEWGEELTDEDLDLVHDLARNAEVIA